MGGGGLREGGGSGGRGHGVLTGTPRKKIKN